MARNVVPPSGEYKFVKLTCSNSAGGSILTLAEVQVRSVHGAAESMSGGIATAQTVNGTNNAGLAIDGIPGTAWTSTAGTSTTGNWWMVEMPLSKDFNELYLMPGLSTHFNNCPRTIVIEASADGVTFDNLGTWTTGAWANGVAKTFAIP